jgi:6-phosphogluconolactonase (cycloisomerase 2 family)
MLAAFVLALFAAALVSCGNGKLPATSSGNIAFATLPSQGSILKLHIDGANGTVSVLGETPGSIGNTPRGLVLGPSNKFLYVANALANTISTFSVAGDGSLSLVADTSVGPRNVTGPWETVIDPSGKYLLVTDNSGYVSVFSLDSTSGAITAATGSPFYASESPTEIVMAPTGNLVYVSNSGSAYGTVTAFTFDPTLASCGAILCNVPGSPFLAGAGASALAVDNSGQYLYVANTTAINNPEQTNAVGNISAFTINTATGALTTVPGSPFFPPFSGSSGPSTLAVIPNTPFLYATSPGSYYSVWCFNINSENGQLTLTAGSPFSVPAGGLFDVIDTNGDFLFIGTTNSNGSIAAYTYDPDTGEPTPVLNSPFSTNAGIPGKMVIVP